MVTCAGIKLGLSYLCMVLETYGDPEAFAYHLGKVLRGEWLIVWQIPNLLFRLGR